ncbi:MAG TPA: hypothetical protein VGW34_01690 [Allosphingosinicella sp.]|nr:hypothetical protein [Allosphingosinicella sp.]
MRNLIAVLASATLLSGCAFRGDVSRMSVDFNATVASSANELTLLNVLRAREHQPLHFTSFSLVRGNIQFTGGAGFNTVIRGAGTTTDTDPAGKVATSVAEGVETFTPNLSAQVVTGPNFDIAVFDTQEFYQGILTSVPTTTVAHYLYQGWRSDLLMYLLVQRVNFRASSDIKGPDGKLIFKKGNLVGSIETMPQAGETDRFRAFVECFELAPEAAQVAPVDLAPVSRLSEITMEDLKQLDGETLELSQSLTANKERDKRIFIRRPASGLERLRLFLRDDNAKTIGMDRDRRELACLAATGFRLLPETGAAAMPGTAAARSLAEPAQSERHGAHPEGEGEDAASVSRGTLVARRESDLGTRLLKIQAGLSLPVDVEFVFRSVDGVFTFLGDYLREYDKVSTRYTVEEQPLFQVAEKPRAGQALIATRLNGRRYAVLEQPGETHKTTMRIIALLQQLVNLQKKSADKPATQAVRVID